MKVQIIPRSKRAKDRISAHGKIMEFIRQEPNGRFLVESLGDTWCGEKWSGWFYLEEATFKPLEEDLNAASSMK